jgi:hypothetical protein
VQEGVTLLDCRTTRWPFRILKSPIERCANERRFELFDMNTLYTRCPRGAVFNVLTNCVSENTRRIFTSSRG